VVRRKPKGSVGGLFVGQLSGLLLLLTLGCAGPPTGDEPGTEDAEETNPDEEASPAEPTGREATTTETETTPFVEVVEPIDFGHPTRFDDRTDARVRSAIRRRIGARPTLVTTRHYAREQGGTTSVSAFTASYVERCVTAGTQRDECTFPPGDGGLATDIDACVFGGIARVDIGPEDDGREGAMRIVGVRTIGDGETCGFDVESLQVSDEDRDDQPEVVLSYGWYELRYRDGERVRSDEGSVRRTMRDDLTDQAVLAMRFYHHPDGVDADDRNMVSQLRHVRRSGHPDLVMHIIDWLSDQCSEADPPRGRGDVCQLRERTEVHRYDANADLWLPPTPEAD